MTARKINLRITAAGYNNPADFGTKSAAEPPAGQKNGKSRWKQDDKICLGQTAAKA
jgi:hypothetical protein